MLKDKITIKYFFNKIKAERINSEDFLIAPFFYQQQKIYTYCQKYIQNKNVLEIGSGNGYGSYSLSRYAKKIVAIDKDSISIEESNKRYSSKNLEFISTSIEEYNTNQRFDVILALQVIEHILDVHRFLKKVILLLNRNGIVIFSTPNASTQSYNENPYHYKEFSQNELYNLLSTYFKRINIYGVHGDNIIYTYEQLRKKQVMSILSKDKWNMRSIVPRRFKQFMFDILSFYRKKLTKLQNCNYLKDISEKNFIIAKLNINKSIDLIAICTQIK